MGGWGLLFFFDNWEWLEQVLDKAFCQACDWTDSIFSRDYCSWKLTFRRLAEKLWNLFFGLRIFNFRNYNISFGTILMTFWSKTCIYECISPTWQINSKIFLQITLFAPLFFKHLQKNYFCYIYADCSNIFR